MYGSYLVGRLVKRADIPASSIDSLAVFVEMNKKPDHVKMWKAGLESGNRERNGAATTSKTPGLAKEKDLIAKTGMGWVEQVVLRGAMALGEVLSRQHVHELGFEGDTLDGTKFKQMNKSARPWYMTFVRTNDAKGLVMWLKRAVNSPAASKWTKASVCLNRLMDELSEITIEQGFLQGFIIQATTVALRWRCCCALTARGSW